MGEGSSHAACSKKGEELKFDVKTQKCLFYSNMNDLRKQVFEATRSLIDKQLAEG